MRLLCTLLLALCTGWTWPVEGRVITSYRNGGDAFAAGQHRGIDIAARPGTPVRAASAGLVRFAGVTGSSGLTVSIRTASFDTSYLHLAGATVRAGTRVREGRRIGYAGTSGSRRSSAAPHLHFGVRVVRTRHDYRDPLGLLPRPRQRGRPRGVPDPHGAPVPAGPRSAPMRAPRATRPRAAPAPRQLPAPVPRSAPAPWADPELGFGPHPLALATPFAPRPGAAAANGPDARLPWLLGCLALLGLGTALGHPEASARMARRGRAWVGARLRPLSEGATGRQ